MKFKQIKPITPFWWPYWGQYSARFFHASRLATPPAVVNLFLTSQFAGFYYLHRVVSDQPQTTGNLSVIKSAHSQITVRAAEEKRRKLQILVQNNRSNRALVGQAGWKHL